MMLKNFLKSQSVFTDLSDRDLDALAHALEIREYPDGHAIIQEGRSGKELYLLVEGRVNVAQYNDETGLMEQINLVQPGELFGLLSLVDHLPTSASCISAGPVKIGVLQHNAYNLLAQSSAPIALGFQLAMAKQLASVLRHQKEVLRSVPQQI
ncbi:cyclic nucleotide-binding domain-containing protein [Thiobacillus sp.]